MFQIVWPFVLVMRTQKFDTEIPPVFDSNDAALTWVMSLVDDMETSRAACDVFLPDFSGQTIRDQERAERVYMVKHGSCLGALGALLRCGRISPVAYNTLVTRVRNTLTPTLVSKT